MKSILVIMSLVSSIGMARSVMAPTGVHKSLGCSAQGPNRFKVYILKNTKQPAYSAIQIVSEQNVVTTYKASEKISTAIGGPIMYSATVPGGNLSLTINMTTSPRPGGLRVGKLVSQVYGQSTVTPVSCARIMY